MRKMAKLNVAIADDNERILTMLDEVLTADDDITVAVSYTHLLSRSSSSTL